ncbi:MAG: putative Ig domain-containing protein [Holophagaceae bacterium]|nr:putative Ig domain-containing protein [Holophagaceae bacterium]
MSIHSLRQGSGRVLLALSMGLGLTGLHTACVKNDSNYTDPAPAISGFYVSKTEGFPDLVKNVPIPVGGTAWFRANFGVKDGTAVITPGNITVVSNKAFPISGINSTTTYTLTVTSGSGKKTTDTVTVTVLAAPSGLTYAHEDVTYYASVKIADNTVATIAGDAPITFTVNPPLPNGLTLNPATGAISGTPAAEKAQAIHTVTATNTVINRSVSRDLKIAVAATPLSFSASPTTLAPGSSTVLSWDANSVPGIFSAVTITANPADITLPATFALAGTANATPVVTTTYTLTATPAGGGAAITKTADVTVGSAPVRFTSFTATPASVVLGQTTNLAWSYTGLALDLTLNGSSVLGSTGQTVTPYGRQNYSLAGSNLLGGDSATLKVGAKGFYHVAGSFSSGTGNVDGGPDAVTGMSTARLYRPNAITWDERANDGTMIVADYTNNLIRRITPDRKVTTIAGTPGVGGVAGTNTDTNSLITPRNTAVDPVTGDIYVGGENYTTKRLLKLSPNGDGTYTASLVTGFTFNTNAFVIDASRKMYFIDFATAAGSLYTMDLTSATPTPTLVASLTANGVVAATAMAKDFNGGRKLLYVACSTTGVNKIMKIDVSGASPVVSLFAGAGAQGYADNAAATAGLLNGPSGVCADDSGNVYIADTFNMAIRMVPASGPLVGALITIAGKTGTATEGYAPSATTWDGTATLPTSTIACLARPYYVAARGNGAAGTKLYVADATGSTYTVQAIREIAVTSPSAGQLTWTLDDDTKPAGYAYAGGPRVVGAAIDEVGARARFNFGTAFGANLATLPDGSKTFAADTGNNLVRVIAADGTVTTLKDATSTAIAFFTPKGVAVQVDPITKALVALFVADTGTTKKLRKFTPNVDGTFTEATFTVAGGTYPVAPNHSGLAVDSTVGMIYATDSSAKVFKIDAATGASTDFVAATGANPTGITLAADGSVWVSVTGTFQVKKFDATGTLQLTVGTGTQGWVDGAFNVAQLAAPLGIAASGNFVYVTNYTNSQSNPQNGIRAIDALGNVTTLLGYASSTTLANLMGLKPGLLNPETSGGSLAAKSMTGAVVFVPQGLSVNADGDLIISTPHSVYQLVAPANQ